MYLFFSSSFIIFIILWWFQFLYFRCKSYWILFESKLFRQIWWINPPWCVDSYEDGKSALSLRAHDCCVSSQSAWPTAPPQTSVPAWRQRLGGQWKGGSMNLFALTVFPFEPCCLLKTGILVLNVLKNLENALKRSTCPLIWPEDHLSRPDPCLDQAHVVQWGILELNLALQLLTWCMSTGENHIFFKQELWKGPPRRSRSHNDGSSQAKLKAFAVLVAVFNTVLPLCLGK